MIKRKKSSVCAEDSQPIKRKKVLKMDSKWEVAEVKKQIRDKKSTQNKPKHKKTPNLKIREVQKINRKFKLIKCMQEKNPETVKKSINKIQHENISREDSQNKCNQKSNSDKVTKTLKKCEILKRKKQTSKNNVDETDLSKNEDLSIMLKKHISQSITAIFSLTQERLKNENKLFRNEKQPIMMQVTCLRVPKVPNMAVKIFLPHSLVLPQDHIALIVSDLKKGRKVDFEPTIEHYQKLLQTHKCTHNITIIPLNQIKTECNQFEIKRKLMSTYDHFLVDGRIAGHATHLLGKALKRNFKMPLSVKMDSKDLQHEINHVLRKTYMPLHSNGDTHTVQVGHTSMEKEHVIENISSTCQFLYANYPGGWENIRSIWIKTSRSLSIPIYVTLKKRNTVEVPYVSPKRPKAYRKVEGELSTLPGHYVTVTPEGDVHLQDTEEEESLCESSYEKDVDKVCN